MAYRMASDSKLQDLHPTHPPNQQTSPPNGISPFRPPINLASRRATPEARAASPRGRSQDPSRLPCHPPDEYGPGPDWQGSWGPVRWVSGLVGLPDANGKGLTGRPDANGKGLTGDDDDSVGDRGVDIGG
ncbi:hypothetical protein B0T18DRAFT_414180 [Schizothecium vesticola]|uniref:Uncharacterized protein n=1 Tax=Schizothecium vesticola TaxID=314040 RepID=A0AA40EP96_9PEZI|nr:hypothetical protein B0T18DRAFT_414180 [Schizothecium vesticola]